MTCQPNTAHSHPATTVPSLGVSLFFLPPCLHHPFAAAAAAYLQSGRQLVMHQIQPTDTWQEPANNPTRVFIILRNHFSGQRKVEGQPNPEPFSEWKVRSTGSVRGGQYCTAASQSEPGSLGCCVEHLVPVAAATAVIQPLTVHPPASVAVVCAWITVFTKPPQVCQC